MTSLPLQEKLGREVLRKLRLATEAVTKEDREIICTEVFNDITGSVDDKARGILGLTSNCYFYEVLAHYYSKVWDAAEALLYTCRRLWSQPYIVPVYTLLLHRWLLVSGEAGGVLERKKHINVLVTGAKQLFDVDANAGTTQFSVLFEDLMASVLAQDTGRFGRIPEASKVELLKLLAGYLPYYSSPDKLLDRIAALPPLSERGRSQPVPDFVVAEVSVMLRSLRSEAGLLRYLAALEPLCKSSALWRDHVSSVALVRLQSELYNLTVPGGPRYYPNKVRRKAMAALDSAFPIGSKSRLLVSLFFRLMHPSDLPMLLWLWTTSWIYEIWVVYLFGSLKTASGMILSLLNLALVHLFCRRSNSLHRS